MNTESDNNNDTTHSPQSDRDLETHPKGSKIEEKRNKRQLYHRLSQVSLRDARAFRRRLKKARSNAALTAISHDIDAAAAKLQARQALVPAVTYPDSLPVSARRDDIAEAIEHHQVVIIAGETGSGKTTQIPKICMELGRGVRGLIGHTQPRRLAARTVAERIAHELGQDIGDSVGYAIRFDDRVSPTTMIKLMTDGILLAEMQKDRYLYAYDTIIIDEAHERSLNIDFLLGYLKQLLPHRPDLKVIITSATIDPERFAKHFADSDGNPAPIIEVSGRTYPVEIRYRPLQQESGDRIVDIDPLDGLCDAIAELMHEGPGDILCFFSGEREIRDAAEAISKKKWKGIDIVPLYGRLSNQEQHRAFSPHDGRRIVLSTNIAETSLTVPGIRYVVDLGTARISRYSMRTKVQHLPIENISQASANQRSGRCGRVADGIAIRLYDEQDFLSRPEFTDPEILRTNLASVILQMAALNLGSIENFPFVESPDQRAIRDGVLLLQELGALAADKVEGEPVLSNIGRQLARIPVDPRLGRMLIEAQRLGCLRDVIVIVAALTIQDVRERPLDHQTQADQQHARFKTPDSDFLSYLALWEYITRTRKELSGNAFRKRMKQEFLHYMRIREWQDLVQQLEQVSGDLGWISRNSIAAKHSKDAVHQALLSGLLSHIGSRDRETKEFFGARGTKFMIFPGSSLTKKPPQFVMAAELVHTSRLWARDCAAIDPAWVESLAGNLLRYQYSEPYWSSKRASAMVHQKTTLFGVTVVADRSVPYHRVDPKAARDMFIRHALVAGQWSTHHEFFHSNAAKLEQATELEDKARRRDIVVDEETLVEFYSQRVPESVTTGALFDQWWKKTRRNNPAALDFDPSALVSNDEGVSEIAFPDVWHHGSLEFELRYRFEPGHAEDGITVVIPVPLLAGVSGDGFDWLVPGVREELVTELIRTLPKPLRRAVVPAPEFAAKALPLLQPYSGPLMTQLADALRTLGGFGINASDFRPEALPPHLRFSFAALDRHGKIIDRDKDLSALQQRQAEKISSSVHKVATPKTPQAQAREWTEDSLGAIAEDVVTTVDGQEVVAYPALVATEQGVGIQAFPTRAAADASMITATLSLLLRDVKINAKAMVNGLPLTQRVAVENYPHGGVAGLVDDARIAAVRDLIFASGGPVRTPQEFQKLREKIAPLVPREVRKSVVALAPALVDYHRLRDELAAWEGDAIADMERQLKFLLPPHAISTHGMEHLRHLPRYFQAMSVRLADMENNPERDGRHQDVIESVLAYVQRRLEKLPVGRKKTRAVKEVFWMVEELRVSLFAQRLGTAYPVSERRIQKAVDKLS